VHIPSPQPAGGLSHWLQSPMPTLHFSFFQGLHSSAQLPQSSGQLVQVSPSPSSQVPFLLQTVDPLSHFTPVSAHEADSASSASPL
jgi:hypothetical protein